MIAELPPGGHSKVYERPMSLLKPDAAVVHVIGVTSSASDPMSFSSLAYGGSSSPAADSVADGYGEAFGVTDRLGLGEAAGRLTRTVSLCLVK
jgi:hypothetical protein